MPNIVIFAIIVVAAYFVGAIPFGLVYSLARGVDIRKIGSGNIGATNVARQFGFVGGFLPIFILDMLKGALPILAVRLMGLDFFQLFDANAVPSELGLDLSMLIAGVVAILGHTFPIYLGFKGGKGVATSAGVMLLLAPVPALIAAGVFLATFLTTKLLTGNGIVAIASIVSFGILPVFVWFFYQPHLLIFGLTVAAGLFIIYTHRSNIAKLARGEAIENKKKEDE